MNSPRTLTVLRWLLVTAALAGIVLVYDRWIHVNPATVALSFLLLVLVLAAKWGLRYATVTSIASAACYNFFFLPPLHSFTIADTQNWVALLAFLTTSIIASRLSQRARDEAEESRTHQRQLDLLLRLSRELLQSDSVASLLSTVPAAVVGATSAVSGYMYLIEGDRLYRAGPTLVSEVEFPHLGKLANALSVTRREGGDYQIPLRSGVRPKGLFVLRSPQITEETANAIGGLISLALDRSQALANLAHQEAAKQGERLRTLMTDSITHELRTPLTSIKGAATTLLSGTFAREETDELLTIIDEESDRLDRLIAEAVQTAQLDSQQVQMHLKPEALATLVSHAIGSCAWIRTQHDLQVDVPPALSARVDPVFFQKALCNLLENAAKYSSPGTQIAVSADAREGGVSISVADQGIGIDDAEQSLIFERFYRSREQATSAPGSGMGLAIARAVVHAHGGEIKVVSQPKRGSVFTIYLPGS